MEHLLERIKGWATHGVDRREGWGKKLKALEEAERKQVNRADRLARKAIWEERRAWTKEKRKEHREHLRAVWAERGGERPKRRGRQKGKKGKKEAVGAAKKEKTARVRKARVYTGKPRRGKLPQDRWDAMSREEKKAYREMHGSLYERSKRDGEPPEASNDTFDEEIGRTEEEIWDSDEDDGPDYFIPDAHPRNVKHAVSSKHVHEKMHAHHTRVLPFKAGFTPPAAAAASCYLGKRVAPGTKW